MLYNQSRDHAPVGFRLKGYEYMNLLKGVLAKFKKRNPVLQEFHFRQALNELGISGGLVEIDHHNGTCWHKKVGHVPLVFAEAWIEKARAFSTTKTQDYYFRGVISPGREWLAEYSDVKESRYGRSSSTKYQLDRGYFEGLSASRFGLAPVGDCPWSYRFFEAIICQAIPIIGEADNDVFSSGFHFLRHGSEHQYDENLCDENYATLVAKHTLRGIGY